MMMKRYRRTAVSQYLVMILILLSIVGIGLLGFFVMSRVPFTDNFVIPWAAGRTWLLAGENPYGTSVIDTALDAVENSPFMAQLPESRLFSQPLFHFVFYIPFSLMPYTISRTIWVTLLGLSVGLVGYLSIQLSGWKLTQFGQFLVILILVFWLPGVMLILGGYLAPVITGLVLISIYLIKQEQEITAGFILALTFSSFLTSGLVLIFLLIWGISTKRWSLLSSFFAGLIFIVLVSFLIMPSWFMDWASVLFNMNINWGSIKTPLMDLAALLPGIAEPLSIFLHVVFSFYALFLLITALGQTGRVFIYKIFSFLILAYLLHTQGSMAYLLFIIPSLLLVFRYWSERRKRFGHIISWVVLMTFAGGSWFFFYPEFDFTQLLESPWVFIGYPLVVLIGMMWIRWWAVNLPKMHFEGP